MNILKKITFFLFLITLSFNRYYLSAEEIAHYYIDIPEGWITVKSENTNTAVYADPTGKIVFEIVYFTGDSFNSAFDIYNFTLSQKQATGDNAAFLFSGKDAIFADLAFKFNKLNVRGYFVFINTKNYDFIVSSYTTTIDYEKNHDLILSALDSFSFDLSGQYQSGPISQFYYPNQSGHQKLYKININKVKININLDPNEIEATQILVEREGRILAGYNTINELKYAAWQRYYRLIYRDNYSRLSNFTKIITKELSLDKKTKIEIFKILLPWIQEFTYNRTDTIADLSSPLETLATLTGDCDSRVLLFLIILHQLKMDAVLLVSEKYQHSALGINLGIKEGAIINYQGKDYLYAELTEKVEMGMVPQKMADPENWTVFPMNMTE